MRRFIFFVTIIFNAVILSAQHNPPGNPAAGSLNSTQWLQDIDFLQKAILRLHPDPFYKNKDLDREKFDKLFNDLRKGLSLWDENKIVTEITRIVGLMNDGHSAIDQFANPGSFYNFSFFPLFLYYFPGGLYVVGAPDAYKQLVGKKLVAIDSTVIGEVIKSMRPIISKDYGNETSLKDGLRYFVTISQYLHGLGIISNPREAIYTFADSGGVKTSVRLTAGSMRNLFAAFDRSGNEGKPLYRQDPMKFYWFRYLEAPKTLYIKYNSELIDTALRPVDFCKKMQEIVDSVDFQKVVIDLRQNQGGNIGTLKPIYKFLTQPKINQYGKLFVLIDRRSQSAATVMAIRLSMISRAIIIGDPVVTAINFFDNDRKFALPNSKLRVGISTHFENAGFPVDSRTAFDADIPMEISATDYFSLKDPVLDFALQHKTTAPKLPTLVEADKNAEGFYQYSALQLLQVKKQGMGWKMIIEDGGDIDFLNTTLYPVSARSFQTDIKGVTASYDKGQITLHTRWGNMVLNKLLPGYISPRQLIQAGEMEKAVSEIKRVFGIADKMELTDIEAVINSWGYELTSKKEIEKAVKIFLLNTELFPGSFNVWDSLGEAYALAGNKEEATRCYKKALELEPGLNSAVRALEKLQ